MAVQNWHFSRSHFWACSVLHSNLLESMIGWLVGIHCKMHKAIKVPIKSWIKWIGRKLTRGAALSESWWRATCQSLRLLRCLASVRRPFQGNLVPAPRVVRVLEQSSWTTLQNLTCCCSFSKPWTESRTQSNGRYRSMLAALPQGTRSPPWGLLWESNRFDSATITCLSPMTVAG
jgi:hypothetical protein